MAGVETGVAGFEAAAEAEGAVDGIEAEVGAGAAKVVAAAGDCPRADGADRTKRGAEFEPWWAVLDNSTMDGVDGAVELGEAAGIQEGGQLVTELEDYWRM